MSDNSLFALNSPAGRKDFLINSAIIMIIAIVSNRLITTYIKPYIINPEFIPIINVAEIILYIFFFIIFISLFERRFYDITGNRENSVYQIAVFFLFVVLFTHSYDILTQSQVITGELLAQFVNVPALCNIFDMILFVLYIIISIIPGRITN